jgi:hypothetical protein
MDVPGKKRVVIYLYLVASVALDRFVPLRPQVCLTKKKAILSHVIAHHRLTNSICGER